MCLIRMSFKLHNDNRKYFLINDISESSLTRRLLSIVCIYVCILVLVCMFVCVYMYVCLFIYLTQNLK